MGQTLIWALVIATTIGYSKVQVEKVLEFADKASCEAAISRLKQDFQWQISKPYCIEVIK